MRKYNPLILGWDIGGAHLKAVLLNTNGDVENTLQLPCPLWKGLDRLEHAIKAMLQAFNIAPFGVMHAITMTGELVDLFASRHEGVMAISSLSTKLLGTDTLFYAANTGFVRLERVAESWASIASTNWHASASALAMQVQHALLIDIGSTTTDIIAISDGKVNSVNLSDAARMADDSLVYTGVVRTPVMALAQKLSFAGGAVNVAAECFATMADVYRLTGELLPALDMVETADGKGKTAWDSARRLARMIGHDVESQPIEVWKNLANTCKVLQKNQVKAAVLTHLKANTVIIGAGAGSFLVAQIAADLNCTYEEISKPFNAQINAEKKHNLALCFSAFAVAYLANKWLANSSG